MVLYIEIQGFLYIEISITCFPYRNDVFNMNSSVKIPTSLELSPERTVKPDRHVPD